MKNEVEIDLCVTEAGREVILCNNNCQTTHIEIWNRPLGTMMYLSIKDIGRVVERLRELGIKL